MNGRPFGRLRARAFAVALACAMALFLWSTGVLLALPAAQQHGPGVTFAPRLADGVQPMSFGLAPRALGGTQLRVASVEKDAGKDKPRPPKDKPPVVPDDPPVDPPPPTEPPLPPAPPGAVSGVACVSGDMADRITFAAPTDGGPVATYTLLRSATADGTYSPVASAPADARIFTVSVEATGAPYYRIATSGPGGDGPVSEAVTNDHVSMSRLISASGGILRSSNGEVILALSAGSFSTATTVTVEEVSASPTGGLISLAGIYEITPSGTLLAPARLSVVYTLRVEHFQVASAMLTQAQLMTYSASTGGWAAGATDLTVADGYLTGTLAHFSYWTGAVIQPHGTTTTAYCSDGAFCHNLSTYPDSTTRYASRDAQVCYNCHGSADLSGGPAGATGENVEAAIRGAGTVSKHPVATGDLYCVSCHDAHATPTSSPSMLRAVDAVTGAYVQGLGGMSPRDAFCWACHGTISNRRIDYLVPGYFTRTQGNHKTAYATSAHAGIATAGPTCASCHTAHGSAYQRLLNARLSASTPATVASDRATGAYAQDCLQCHDGATAGAANIKQYVTYGASDTGSMSFGGHRVKSATGSLPVDAPLPCTSCHGPHGSSRGNASLISDTLGGSLETATATGVRKFCLSCHVTSDLYSWDSTAGAYSVVSGSATVYGLPRNGGAEGSGPYGQGKNWLLLKTANGHARADGQSCYQCHGGDYGSPESSNVHDPRSYSASAHLATPPAAVISIRGVDYGTFACNACHELDLMEEHGKSTSSSAPSACGACHPTPRNTFASWGKDCSQGGCHVAKHAEADADHAAPSVNCTAAGCHDGSIGLAALHVSATTTVDGQTRTSCAVCHAEGAPTTGDCATCHGFTTHPPHNVSGTCTTSSCHGPDPMVTHGQTGGPGCQACHPPAATKTFVCRACHAAPAHAVSSPNHGSGEACVSCHSTSTLTNVHADRCDWCHSGPVSAYAGGCSQSGCHTTYHTRLPGYPVFEHDPPHENYGSDCWSCHPGDGGNCESCHFWDRTAPVTTSNARANYTAAAVITLTPTEELYGSGARATYYQIDGNPVQTGRIVTVLGPESGQETHTLEFWSIDYGLNTEAHHIVYFTVSAGIDGVGPSGTMSVNAGATYATSPAATLDSVVTDAATGVVRMSIDPGSGTFGAWQEYATSAPFTLAAGDGTKTVRVRYQDAFSNELVLSDTIILDATPPAGTMSVNNGAATTTSISVTVNSAVSGATEMRVYGGAGWSAWTAYSATQSVTLAPALDGLRWVSAQYRDVAGNVLSLGDNISLDIHAPAGAMSVNSNAAYTTSTSVTLNSAMTDAYPGTGMSQLRVDPGTGTFGSWTAYAASYAFTLAGGDGTKTVRAQYSDVAGNIATQTDTIVLDTAPPTGTMVVNGDATTTTARWVSIDSAIADATSGISQMSVDPGTGVFGTWITYVPTYTTELPPGDGTKTVRVQYKDYAGLTVTRSDIIELVAGSDSLQPVGSVLINGGASVATTTTISLTIAATDDGGSGVAWMRFSADNATWTGWEAYATTRSWTLTGPDGDKLVYAQFRDGAGNVSQVCADAITLDTAPPVGRTSVYVAADTWVDANEGASGEWGTFSIFVNDTLIGTKVAGSGPTWDCPEVDIPSGGHIDIVVDCGFSSYSWIFAQVRPTTWTVTLPAGTTRLKAATWTGFPALSTGSDWYDPYEDYYRAVVVGTGTIENICYTPSSDTVPPTGGVTIDAGAAYTATPSATLAVTGSDGSGSGVQLMRFSNDNLAWSAWEAFGTSKGWSLTAGTGAKTVYLQLRDFAGNISTTYSDAIGLDLAAPAGTIVVDGGASTAATRTVTLGLSAADVGGSGVAQMRFSNDNATWSAWEDYAASKSWTLTWGDGAKTVYVQFRDAVGNASGSYSDGITLATPGGTATLWFRWWGNGEATLSLLSDTGEVLASTYVYGNLDDLSWYVTVPAGQRYYMRCDGFYDWANDVEGGNYGVWTDDTSINADGVLSPGETVTWNY